MWAKESSRGKNMLGPMTKYGQAKGHFQFLDGTAKEQGVTDPFDLTNAATGAAKYMGSLMQRYNGDLQKALAAYNWGMGNVDRKGMANAPWETRDYVGTISRGVQLQQTNVFHINGTDAQGTANAVERKLGGANSNLTRNLAGAIQ